jgi:hypothetical protein
MWIDSWVETMDKFIGQEHIIESINGDSFYIKNNNYGWPLCMLNNPIYEVY